MHSFSSSVIFQTFIAKCRNDTTLYNTDSFRDIKDVLPSKSAYNVPSIEELDIMQRIVDEGQVIASKTAKTTARRVTKVGGYLSPIILLETWVARGEVNTEGQGHVLKTKKRERPVTPTSDVQLDVKKQKLEPLTCESGTSQQTDPSEPSINGRDANSHYNDRDVKFEHGTTSSPFLDQQPDVIAHGMPAPFPNEFEEDDDDLDSEVAMILDKAEAPTVRDYRPMPEYYVPRLVQNREAAELEETPYMALPDGSYEEFPSPQYVRTYPRSSAIRILDPWPCLYRNKRFGELNKVGSIDVEDSPSFWERPNKVESNQYCPSIWERSSPQNGVLC